MEIGSEPVANVIDRVTAYEGRAYARWAAERTDNRWQLRYAEIFLGAPPPGFVKRRWEYPDHLFLERPATIKQITAALTGRTVRTSNRSLRGAALHSTANRSRQPSYADFGGQRLPWPTRRYELHRMNPAPAAAGNDPLISRTSPSFAYTDAAFTAFFRPGASSRWEHNAGLVALIADTGSRIERVHIKPGQLIVDVAGHDLNGCVLQASSYGHVQTQIAENPGPYTFVLPEPFNHELLVVLTGDDWRDLRLINPPGMPTAADPSIIWDDPQVVLEALLARGEGQSVEFKQQLPDKLDSSVRTALKAIPAFANTTGGTLVFGVNDDGVAVGFNADSISAAARLTDLIQGNVRPVPDFRVEATHIDGHPVIVVHVQPGHDRPYGLFRDPPQIYVRHGATSFHATREEIITLSARTTWYSAQ